MSDADLREIGLAGYANGLALLSTANRRENGFAGYANGLDVRLVCIIVKIGLENGISIMSSQRQDRADQQWYDSLARYMEFGEVNGHFDIPWNK